MILNFKQLIDHNKSFYDTFVDLKVTGWNTYSNALNAYTFNFFKDQIAHMDNEVNKLGTTMKKGVKNV
jgi:hypothetical protein|tara:strand:+ start:25545 stop:25748 length:204 start_codon:yes stop_codon:yes gene_type:complete